jgi:hypothetical protein
MMHTTENPESMSRNDNAPNLILRARLERAFATTDSRLERLGMAGTSVRFQDRDLPDAAVTVLLDRQPPAVAGAEEPAEVRIVLSSEQFKRFALGILELQPALLNGEAAWSGPVRKYLAVHSVLRSLLIDLPTGSRDLPGSR